MVWQFMPSALFRAKLIPFSLGLAATPFLLSTFFLELPDDFGDLSADMF
jgi:hypothetical protein